MTATLQVPVKAAPIGGRWAHLRALHGHDEACVGQTGGIAPADFLDRLIVPMPGTTVAPGTAHDLAITDCDRLFAAIRQREFGDEIQGSTTCVGCATPYELRFSLEALVKSQSPESIDMVRGPDDQGLFELADGQQFRLPTTADQFAIGGLDPARATDELLARCIKGATSNLDSMVIQEAMAQVGPVLDLDLDGDCPDCGHSQSTHFEVKKYLLTELATEHRFFHQEVHAIAIAYGWGHGEVLGLTRADRRAYVQLIDTDRQASAKRGRSL